mgnify:CR=1 FL=1
MGRAIDKQTMLGLIIDAKRTDPETGSFAEWLAEYLAEHMPTFPPPNEPLTCEGCAEDGKWEWEWEYQNGAECPCTYCKRRAADCYRRPPEVSP